MSYLRPCSGVCTFEEVGISESLLAGFGSESLLPVGSSEILGGPSGGMCKQVNLVSDLTHESTWMDLDLESMGDSQPGTRNN